MFTVFRVDIIRWGTGNLNPKVRISNYTRVLFQTHQYISYSFPVNLATGGAATQSSTYTDESADKAIDGDPDTTCTETVIGSNPWWRLDLGDVYHVNRVVITNTFICCSSEINGAEIHIGNSLENDGNNNPMWESLSVVLAGGVWADWKCRKWSWINGS